MPILFWQISQKARVALLQYQHKKYGTKLSIPSPPEMVVAEKFDEEESTDLQAIDREMRQRPHPGRKKGEK